MKKALLAVLSGFFALVAASAPSWAMMAEPEPSFDNPRKVVMSLSEKDEKRMNAVLNNVANVQKAYGMDNVELAVVAYGPGIWALLSDSPVRARIESLQKYDVTFVACGNTLDSIHRDDLIDGVERVQAGLVELVERRLSGWVDLKP